MRAAVNDRCGDIPNLLRPSRLGRLHPLALAAVAGCESDRFRAEKMFQRAEKLAPGNALILSLHAQYLWPFEPERACVLWKEVLTLTHDEEVRALAQAYLAGHAPLSMRHALSKNVWLVARLVLGEMSYSIPLQSPIQGGPLSGAFATLASVDLSGQAHLGAVDLGARYDLADTMYFSSPSADSLEQSAQIPLTVPLTPLTALELMPFGSYLLIGRIPYEWAIGGSAALQFHREESLHSVALIFTADHLDPAELSARAGNETGVRYDYERTSYPWSFQLEALVSHTSAGVLSKPAQGASSAIQLPTPAKRL